MNDKNNSKITKSISNPFSTGGGGATFENLVGAYYVSQLLSDKLIYGHLEAGTVKEIAFQNRWIGLDVDDIIIYGSTKIISEKPKNNIRPKLILQIKNRLNFRLSDTKFINVIKECWQTFNHSSFNLKYDQIGLMLGILNLKVKKHFLRLLEWAKTSDSFTEFFSKINVINYASQEMRDYIDMIKIILPKANEENLWKFLQHLNVLELDLISSNSKTYLDSVENLRSIVINHDFKKAIALFSYILERCAYYNKNGGIISFNTLYQDITANSFLERRNIKNYYKKKIKKPNELFKSFIPHKIYLDFDMYDDALRIVKDMLCMIKKSKDHLWKALILNNIGLIYQNQGNYSRALEYYGII